MTDQDHRVMAALQLGLILAKGPRGHCDDAALGGPIVKWHPTEKQWWMWYYCRDTEWPKDVAPAFGTGRVALAKSPDGINWRRYDGPLTKGAVFEPNPDAGAFDSQHVASGDVLFHDGEWIMAYFGGDSSTPKELGGVVLPAAYQFKGYRGRPGLARSTDGVNWTRIKGAGFGGSAVDIGDYTYGAFPNIIFDGKRFLLYYAMLSPKVMYWETQVAESIDLTSWRTMGRIKWDKDPAPWELGGSVTRHIMPNPHGSGPKWLMTYSALDSRVPEFTRSIAAATSDDGIIWSHLLNEPLLHKGTTDAWDGGGVSYSYLTQVENKLYLYYYGFKDPSSSAEPGRGIGIAISDDGDMRKFIKYSTGRT